MAVTYRSARHAGDTPAAVLFGQALARPIGVCALPVMIGALVVMLEGGRPLPFLYVGFPIALAVAWWWTASRLRAEIVEMTLDDGFAAVRSAWDVAVRHHPRVGSAVLDVRRRGPDLLVTVGLDTVVLRRTDWPDLDRIESAVRSAREGHIRSVRRKLDRP